MGAITLEVNRPLAAVTDQDRSISAGEQVILYAYGSSAFKYHKKNRGTSRITLFKDDSTPPSGAERPLPNDIVQNFTVLNTNYAVPPNRTAYGCTTARIPLA